MSYIERSPKTLKPGIRAGRSPWVGVVLAVCTAVTLSSCSSGGSGTDSDGGTPKVVVALSGATSAYAIFYIAKSEGFYEQENVEVDLQNVGASATTLLVSGQADLAGRGVGDVFTINKQGKEARIIYNWKSGGTGSVEVRADSPYESVEDLAGKRIATGAIGGSAYGYAAAYSSWLVDHGHEPFQLVPVATGGDALNLLLSNQVEGTITNQANMISAIVDGKVKVVLDAADEQAVEDLGMPAGLPENGLFGIADNLEDKREGIVRYIRAINDAQDWIEQHTEEEIAASLRTLEEYQPIPLVGLVNSLKADKPFLLTDGGVIDEARWPDFLAGFAKWGIPNLDMTVETYPFASVVDDSYAEAAKQG